MQPALFGTSLGPVSQIQKVLYIDDDPFIAEVVLSSLELFTPWQVATANGAEALDRATGQPWDVILLEIALASGTGQALYEQLRASPETQAIPLVLLTSKLMPIDRRAYQHMAIAGVLAKPFDPVKLGGQIASLLGHSGVPATLN